MPALGTVSLALSFAATLLSAFCLLWFALKAKATRGSQNNKAQHTESLQRWQFVGSLAVWSSALLLTLCCAILAYAFLSNDNSILYVARYRSESSSSLALLFKIAGVWAGRQGSLLFWAWLISLFSSLVTFKAWRTASGRAPAKQKSDDPGLVQSGAANPAPKSTSQAAPDSASKQAAKPASQPAPKSAALDAAAIAVTQLVLLAFLAILTLDEGSRPFVPLGSEFLDAAGELMGNAALWRMNVLLEHWAMAVHPPTLFIGYAGMTIPFAYAVAALIVDDPSRTWVERASRYTLVSWLFLGVGIGLGAVWAYVVLGWGGYWGWDPVENASLLSWVIGVALIHSMTIYRTRDSFKRWTVMLACLTFAFVIVGTFITRSGVIESVHAFETNLVSFVAFGILIIAPICTGALGLLLRRSSFKDATDESTEAEAIMSRDVAYYLNNVIMVVCTVFLTYMTLSSALPSWMPFGGQALGANAYNAIARPLGVLYCLVIAVCPLLSWRKTKAKDFFSKAWLPALIALVVFLVLCVYFMTTLLPSYMQTMAQGGTNAQNLREAGPFVYYALITILGFLAASLLVFNSLVMLVRALIKRNLRVQSIGGFIAHLAMGVMIIGLIGSSMYVFEYSDYLPYDEKTDVAGEPLVVKDYTLSYVSNSIEPAENKDDVFYSVTLAVERNGVYLGELSPSIQVVMSSSQRLVHAAVLSLPTEDLFVVYHGVNDAGDFSLQVHINPLIGFVWLGFGLLMVGTAIAALGKRR